MSKKINVSADKLMRMAYLKGFKSSGVSNNGEYPYKDQNRNPEDDREWCLKRDQILKELKTELKETKDDTE